MGLRMQPTTQPTTIKPRDLHRLLREEHVLLVDVRKRDEHRDWRIPGSVNIPLADLPHADLPAMERVVVYCATGPRSLIAQEILAKRGVRASHLDGGMTAWNGVYQQVSIPATDDAEIVQLQRVGKGCLSYLVVKDDEAVAIDPTIDVAEFVDAAAARGARIVAIVDTHAHADHASGSRLLAAATGATYFAPPEVGERVTHAPLVDGALVKVGTGEIRALATPGHTPGSMTLLFQDVAFTGDTIFLDSVGRPDLGQDASRTGRTLWRTLHEQILSLAPDTRVLPGHVAEPDARKVSPIVARLGEIRSMIPALAIDEDEFVAWVIRNTLPKPANFETIKRLNLGLAHADLAGVRKLEAGPNRCAVSE